MPGIAATPGGAATRGDPRKGGFPTPVAMSAVDAPPLSDPPRPARMGGVSADSTVGLFAVAPDRHEHATQPLGAERVAALARSPGCVPNWFAALATPFLRCAREAQRAPYAGDESKPLRVESLMRRHELWPESLWMTTLPSQSSPTSVSRSSGVAAMRPRPRMGVCALACLSKSAPPPHPSRMQ